MMKNKKHNILLSAFVIGMLCCLVSVSCSGDSDNVSSPGSLQSVEVGFSIRLGNDYTSRAVTVEDLPGTGYENYIDIAGEDFMFLFFDADNKFLETMEVKDIYPVNDTKYPTKYEVVGSLTSSINGTCKVVVLVNWGNYPATGNLKKGETTLADLCSDAIGIYDYTGTSAAPFTPSENTPIPMYGVKTCTDVKLIPGFAADLGTIDLLRAISKVVVVSGDNTDADLQISSVTLENYSTKGYCAPINMYDNTVNHNINAGDTPHIPANNTVGAELAFRKLDDGSFLVYIPEYKNVFEGTASVHSYINVEFTSEPGYRYDIQFCEYADGKPTDNYLDILRNYCYKFTITSRKDLNIKVDVVPYGEKYLDPVFGLDD